MKPIKSMLYVSGLGLALAFGSAIAADGTGVARAAQGTVDAVTAPGKVVEGISDESKKNGPVAGAVVGTAKGTVNAVGQVVQGGAAVGVGAVETGVGVVKTVLEPVTGK